MLVQVVFPIERHRACMMRTLEGKWSEMQTFGVAEKGSLLRKRPRTFAVWPIASERRRGRAKVNHYQ